MFAGLNNGSISEFSSTGALKRTLASGGSSYETGMCFDGAGNLYSTNFGSQNMTKFDNVGTQTVYPWVSASVFASSPESCVVDNHQNVYVGSVDTGALRKFDVNGNLLQTFNPATEDRGIDWIDLSGDQCTMFYTSEGSSVRAFNVCTNTQLADFATGLPGSCYALKILHDGHVAVACASEVVLLNKDGSVNTTYTAASIGDSSNNLFAFNLTPDDSAFWTADLSTGDIWKVRVSDGVILTHFTGGAGVSGLAVFGEGGPVGQPLRPSESFGGAGLSSKNVHCSTSRPVDCESGNFYHTFSDINVPGRGLPLDLTRTYNALGAATDSPFGFGWSSSYTDNLNFDTTSGDVTVVQENGSTATFSPDGSGGFTAPPHVFATLAKNTDGTYSFVRQNRQTFTFSASGQLLSEKDLNGYVTALTYNSLNQIATVADESGRKLTFTYGANGKVSGVTDPAGRTVSYGYDGAVNLTSATDVAGGVWHYAYDTNHLMTSMTDPRGGVLTNTYDPASRVITQIDPQGHKTTYAYTDTSDGTSTTITDPNGNDTQENYSAGELTSVTKALGTAQAATWTYAYDQYTLGVTALTDPNNNVTRRTYDPNGDLTSVTDGLGRTSSATYNAFEERLTATDPAGTTTTYTYDSSGNLTNVSRPLDGTSSVRQTSLSYSDSAHPGDVTALTDPNGKNWLFSYDSDGDLTSSTDPLGDKTTYTYDAVGRRLSMVSPRGNVSGGNPSAFTTTYQYDPFGDITKTTDPLGHATTVAYDANRNRTSLTDANGNVTAYTYDGDDQLTKVTRADGTTLSYGYDGNGNQTTQTDGAGRTTAYAYDALNRLTSTTDPLGRSTTYGYDGAGNRTSLVDPSGRTTSLSYDAANQLTQTSYSDGTTHGVTYSYDADGQRTSMTDGTGTSSYVYDSLNRLTSSTNGAEATISYGYDLVGNETSLTYPNGQTVDRTFDDAGRLTAVTDWLGHTTNFGYDADGNATGEAYPNGVQASSAFDNADQVTSITDQKAASTLASFTYARDNLGQLTSTTPTGVPTGPETYGYTQLNQLASLNSQPYGYDHADNLTKLADGTTQTFDAANELTASTTPGATTPPPTSTLAVDKTVSADQKTQAATITSPTLSTSGGNELLLAMVSADGPRAVQTITKVTGGGLTWSLGSRANGKPGTAEIWQAYSTKKFTAKITAALAHGGYHGSITVVAFVGAAPKIGATGHSTGDGKQPAVALMPVSDGSFVFAAGHDADRAVTLTPAAGQTVIHQSPRSIADDTYWTQRLTSLTKKQIPVTISDRIPSVDDWEFAAVEVVPATSGTGGGGNSVSTTYTYDKQGNRISTTAGGSITKLTYDQANRLTTYGTIATYSYNGDGLREAKTVGGTTTAFAWDQSSLIPLLLADGSDYYAYGVDGRAIEKISGTAVTYLHQDQIGSTRLLTDASAAVVGTYTYDPNGRVTNHSGPASVTLEYNGQYTDAETGYQYHHARYYDPATGQFLSADPLKPMTQASYAYAGDNPLTFTDPTGLSWWNPISWTAHTWTNVLGGVGLALGVAAVIVGAAPAAVVLGGLAIVVGGVAAAIGLGQAAQYCFTNGWGGTGCGQQINHANINTLFTAVTSWFGVGAKAAVTVGQKAVGTASAAAQYVGGLAVDWLFDPARNTLQCS